jgi:hypothetical protein
MLPQTIAAVLRTLNRSKIPYLFFGMEALNVYLERELEASFGTKDSDFLFDGAHASPATILKALQHVPFPEEVIVMGTNPGRDRPTMLFDAGRWKKTHLPKETTISITSPMSDYHIDLLIGTPVIPFEDLWRRSKRARYFGVPIRIAARHDILSLKEAAGRPQDKIVLARLRYKKPWK